MNKQTTRDAYLGDNHHFAYILAMSCGCNEQAAARPGDGQPAAASRVESCDCTAASTQAAIEFTAATPVPDLPHPQAHHFQCLVVDTIPTLSFSVGMWLTLHIGRLPWWPAAARGGGSAAPDRPNRQPDQAETGASRPRVLALSPPPEGGATGRAILPRRTRRGR
jgi:hypothetical protein